ncbi:hypothetical protein [Pyrococcus abyssi]|uniref:Uncharacterized protein n=1 Tax=Pyrococcus abyssi (strain GE5 / Orsay) TaxID=272844 RepID=Q9V1Z3_PYRAB|nr:hypothetical protein [Pyrococcus abyssi]CAB49205.1 Hypothetical protein PAB0191 [Pyrococcus abyssi GE5]CCE69658.1 TPA: hypothetical protein PAB0191 [Pyrococcus abyssi GE5]
MKRVLGASILLVMLLFFSFKYYSYTSKSASNLIPQIYLGYAFSQPNETIELNFYLTNFTCDNLTLESPWGFVEKRVNLTLVKMAGFGEISLNVTLPHDLKGKVLVKNCENKYYSLVRVKVEEGHGYLLRFHKWTSSVLNFEDTEYVYEAEVYNPLNTSVKLLDIYYPVEGVKIISFGFANGTIYSHDSNLSKVLPPRSRQVLMIRLYSKPSVGLVFKPKLILEVDGKIMHSEAPGATMAKIVPPGSEGES